MNLEQTTRLVQFLASLYTTWKPTEGTYAAWGLVLGDQDAEAIGQAALRWTREANRFPPSPGELVELAKPAASKVSGSEAWESLIREIRAVGYMGSPRFRDEKIGRCVRFLGGWTSICGQLTSEVASNRARFIEHYENLATKERGVDAQQEAAALAERAAPLMALLGLGSSGTGPRRLIDPQAQRVAGGAG